MCFPPAPRAWTLGARSAALVKPGGRVHEAQRRVGLQFGCFSRVGFPASIRSQHPRWAKYGLDRAISSSGLIGLSHAGQIGHPRSLRAFVYTIFWSAAICRLLPPREYADSLGESSAKYRYLGIP